ncbi:caspase, EACC1-associated type [Dactylosporangium sp. CS-033363]|uniref:caspase, EACC1-associated type n=1 Tax=Dactylosporangium sp. CS-033363 TaxID=3239935 RepID=UPI003D8FC45E
MVRYRALLIGNSRYDELRPLGGPRNDLTLLGAALQDGDFGMFAGADVMVRPETTIADMRDALEGFFADAHREDVLLFYFSGHGKIDIRHTLYLCARDSRVGRLNTTAVSSRWLNDLIESSPARQKAIILDCCHSGAFKGEDIATPVAGRGRFVIAGCSAKELAADALETDHASPFTTCLVAGLRGGVTRPRTPGQVTIEELYDYVHEQLKDQPGPTPERRFDGAGSLLIARRPIPVAPPVLSLSRDRIDLQDIDAGEELPPERIRLVGLDGATHEWTATTQAPWVRLECHDDSFDVHLVPPAGRSRANVEVFDRTTGKSLVVRISTIATAPPAPSPPPHIAAVTLPPLVVWADEGRGFAPQRTTDGTPAAAEFRAAAQRLIEDEVVQPAVRSTVGHPVYSLRVVKVGRRPHWCFAEQGRGGPFGVAGTCRFQFLPYEYDAGRAWAEGIAAVGGRELRAARTDEAAVRRLLTGLLLGQPLVRIPGSPAEAAVTIFAVLNVLPRTVAASYTWSTCPLQEPRPKLVTAELPAEIRIGTALGRVLDRVQWSPPPSAEDLRQCLPSPAQRSAFELLVSLATRLEVDADLHVSGPETLQGLVDFAAAAKVFPTVETVPGLLRDPAGLRRLAGSPHLVREWAMRDPAAALKALEGMREQRVRRAMLDALADRLADGTRLAGSEAAAALVDEVNTKGYTSAVREIVEARGPQFAVNVLEHLRTVDPATAAGMVRAATAGAVLDTDELLRLGQLLADRADDKDAGAWLMGFESAARAAEVPMEAVRQVLYGAVAALVQRGQSPFLRDAAVVDMVAGAARVSGEQGEPVPAAVRGSLGSAAVWWDPPDTGRPLPIGLSPGARAVVALMFIVLATVVAVAIYNSSH